jgi:prevent-host-death family protein
MDIGAKDLRNGLSEILDRVARGERIRILRRGKPVAELRPLVARRRGLPDLSAFRARIRVRGRPTSEEVRAARDEERF